MTSLFLLLPYSVQLEVSGEGHKEVDRKQIVVDWVDNEGVPRPDCPCNHQEIIIADSFIKTTSHTKSLKNLHNPHRKRMGLTSIDKPVVCP